MNALAKIVVAVVVLAILGGGGYAIFHKNGASPTTNQAIGSTPAPNPNSGNDGSSAGTTTSIAATITFSDNGFSPAVTTVKAGSTVQITNKSSQLLDFDSDPHPEHTDEPELNAGDIGPGQSKTFVVTKTGRWGFHDHLNPGFTGTLNVD